VLLGDVAEVREVEAEISGVSRTDGEPSLGLNITKEQDANTVEVAEGVKEQLEEVRDTLGEEQVFIVFNSAEDVEESVNGIVQEGLIGAVLAIVIIFAFLGSLRATDGDSEAREGEDVEGEIVAPGEQERRQDRGRKGDRGHQGGAQASQEGKDNHDSQHGPYEALLDDTVDGPRNVGCRVEDDKDLLIAQSIPDFV